MIKHGGKIFKMYLSRLIIIPILIINFSSSKAALIDVEAPGIYGGFWRDLYKLGPVVIDTIGADLGVFGGPSFKMGLSFATVVGLLSTNEKKRIRPYAARSIQRSLLSVMGTARQTLSRLASQEIAHPPFIFPIGSNIIDNI